jgi:hypothetical protein
MPTHGLPRKLISVALALAAVATWSAKAGAETVDRLIEQGVALRAQGKPEEALDTFAKAHALAPSARTLAQMGLAEGALHRWLAAEDHVTTALAAHDTPWIEVPRNRQALEQALLSIRAHIGEVRVIGPSGAQLTANGRPIGQLPLAAPLRLAEGPVRIEASAPGVVPAATRVAVLGWMQSTVVLQMAPLAAPPSTGAFPQPTPADDDTGGRRWKTWTGWSLVGLSGAAIGTGVAWLAINGDPDCGAPAGSVCHHLYDTKTQGWVAVGAGAAAGAAGAFLIWSVRRVPVGVAFGPGSLALVGRF